MITTVTKIESGIRPGLKLANFFTGLILLYLFAFTTTESLAQETTSVPGITTVCPYGEFDGHYHTPAAAWIREKLESQSLIGDAPCSTIQVTYNGFSPAAQAAFQAAVDIWETVLSSSITIKVQANWMPLGSNTLGSAGPSNFYANFTNAPTTDYYASALADQISGVDQDPGGFDINSNFNSSFDWYLGTDGNTPFNQIDLVSVVLHELGHGLGIISSQSYNSFTGLGTFGDFSFGIPFNYDNFLTQGAFGTSLVNLSGTGLGSAFVSNNVYNDSPLAVAAIGGAAPRIYAPSTYAAGSSISHWDEGTYPSGNINSLMTPSIAYGEAIHNPGDITIGLLENMGWTICYATNFCPLLELTVGDACDDGNPSTSGDIVTPDCQCVGTSSISNDMPCEATPLIADGSIFLSSNVGSSADFGEVTPPAGSNGCQSQDGWCAGELNVATSVWFTFTAPPSGGVTISTCNVGTTFDTQLALYSVTDCDNYATYNLIAANDDLAGCGQIYASQVTACVNPNEVYYIQVDGYGSATGEIAIRVTEDEGSECVPACLNPTNFGVSFLDGTNTEVTLTTCIYEGEYRQIANVISGNDYTFTSNGASGGYMTVRSGTFDGLVIGSGFSPLTVTSDIDGSLFVHFTVDEFCETAIGTCVTATAQCITCPPPLDCPALEANIGDPCDDGNEGTENDVVTADCECTGTIVYDCPVLEGNFGDACDDGNPLTINDVISETCGCSGAPVNDECDGSPTALAVNDPGDCAGNETLGTTTGANASPGSDCEDTSPDVFYTFNAGESEDVIINLNAITATDLVISVLEESCGATAIVQCSIGTFQSLSVDVNPGSNYYVRIHSLSAVYAGDFAICIEAVAADFATINGSITGWSATCASRDINIYLLNESTGIASPMITTTLNVGGDFTIGTDAEIAPGTYSVWVKVSGTLAISTENVVLGPGINAFSVGPVVRGDVNNNNGINILDYSAMSVAFGTAVGNQNYNILADLNCDGVINILDVSILGLGFPQAGDPLPVP